MSSQSRPKHILAVNESEDILELFRILLEEEGYRVTAHSYITKDLNRIVALNIDLIILDYMWDYEDSGWAFLQMLKMSPATTAIPVVLCTGAVARVRELGAHLQHMNVRVVIKPFDLDNLLAQIALALNESGIGMATASADAGKAVEPRED